MRGKNNKKYMLVILLLLVVGISIGYAALTTTLNINGATTIEKASWDIHFENLVKSDGSVTATTEASIDSTKTLIEYTVTLAEPGDFYEFTVDMVNKGTIDAMISEVLKEGLSSDQEKYIEYTATYTDGVELEEKDYLKSGETQNIKVRVKYREDISAEDLPTDESAISLSFKVTYVQADETAKEKSQLLCVRATTLHTEECIQTNTEGYCSAAGYTKTGLKGTTTITYGNLGTKGKLTSGDAFDCDVNGDGIFNGTTERFYYVTDLDSNSDYAVLIYYSDVASGSLSNDFTNSYSDDFSTDVYYGPASAILQLPTTVQWKTNLLYTSRNIKDEKDNIRVSNFSYEGYAARLLSISEMGLACNMTIGNFNTGELDKCLYFLEKTSFSSNDFVLGYWLENPYSAISLGAWSVNSKGRFIDNSRSVNNSNGVGTRPVIEVPKSKILY